MELIGTKAPETLGHDQEGNEIRLSDFAGQTLVLYFYPKDMTPGCTKEACSFRDGYEELRKRNIAVIGISVDDEESHQKFIDQYHLPFPLIANTNHDMVKHFGVWTEKSTDGKKNMGTQRTTFIINGDGIIEKVFTSNEIDTATHAKQILDTIEAK